MGSLQREIWEGWTVQHFIDELSGQIDLIMREESWQKPFKTKPNWPSIPKKINHIIRRQFRKLTHISLRSMV